MKQKPRDAVLGCDEKPPSTVENCDARVMLKVVVARTASVPGFCGLDGNATFDGWLATA